MAGWSSDTPSPEVAGRHRLPQVSDSENPASVQIPACSPPKKTTSCKIGDGRSPPISHGKVDPPLPLANPRESSHAPPPNLPHAPDPFAARRPDRSHRWNRHRQDLGREPIPLL